jgi:hypothetical protein
LGFLGGVDAMYWIGNGIRDFLTYPDAYRPTRSGLSVTHLMVPFCIADHTRSEN